MSYFLKIQEMGSFIKRVYRIYRERELNLRIKPRKHLKRETPDVLSVPNKPNDVWSMDFMVHKLSNGRAFRAFNVLDDFNRRDRTYEIAQNKKKIAIMLCYKYINE